MSSMISLISVAVALSLSCVSSSSQVPNDTLAARLTSSQQKPTEFSPVGFLQASITPKEFDYKIEVSWIQSGKKERVEPELLFQGDTFRLNGDGPEPGVFVAEKDRYLVWGTNGWAWAYTQAPWGFTPFEKPIDDAIAQSSAEFAKQTNQDGWTLHRGWLIELSKAPILSMPISDSAPLFTAFPSSQESTGHFKSHGKYLKEGFPPPIMKELVREDAPKARNSALALPLERKGDWIKVLFPAAKTSVIGVQFWDVPGDDDPGVLVKWDTKKAGWIRWRSPGSVEGSNLVFQGYSLSFWGFH